MEQLYNKSILCFTFSWFIVTANEVLPNWHVFRNVQAKYCLPCRSACFFSVDKKIFSSLGWQNELLEWMEVDSVQTYIYLTSTDQVEQKVHPY